MDAVANNSTDGLNFQLTNSTSNGAQTVGTLLNSVGFSAVFSNANGVPDVTNIQFNGATICTSGLFFFLK